VFTRAAYEGRLLQGIYDDLAPLDPEGVLRHEWVNARGCIARFDRGAIEIRLLDIQECPRADIAVCAAVIAAVRALVEERWSDTARQRRWDERELEAVLLDAIRDGDHAVIESRPLLEAFGYPERGAARLGELWQYLVEELLAGDPSYPEWEEPLRVITREGCLARRLLGAAERAPPAAVYRRLAECLDRGEVFR
jgi:hypothetical protein